MAKTNTSTPYLPPENISTDSIRNQLQRILVSPEFTATESQQKFLKFVVLETLSGNSDEIKGFTVATRVFGRGDEFDQAIDPIVSIQANKLRRAWNTIIWLPATAIQYISTSQKVLMFLFSLSSHHLPLLQNPK